MALPEVVAAVIVCIAGRTTFISSGDLSDKEMAAARVLAFGRICGAPAVIILREELAELMSVVA